MPEDKGERVGLVYVRLIVPLHDSDLADWEESMGQPPTAQGIMDMLRKEANEGEALLKEFPGTDWRVAVHYGEDRVRAKGVIGDRED